MRPVGVLGLSVLVFMLIGLGLPSKALAAGSATVSVTVQPSPPPASQLKAIKGLTVIETTSLILVSLRELLLPVMLLCQMLLPRPKLQIMLKLYLWHELRAV